MFKKYKYLSIFFLIVFLFSGFCFARRLEVPLPGLEEPTLPGYVAYFFTFVIGVAGLLAVLALVLGGVRYLTSFGNPEVMSDAKQRMFGGILGLILLTSSFLILKTINPELIIPELRPLIPLPGVYLAGGGERKPCPMFVSDTSKIPSNLTQIEYDCGKYQDEWPNLLIFFYDEPGSFKIEDFSFVDELACGGTISPRGSGKRAFEIRYKNPGIYLYREGGCLPSAYRSGPHRSNIPLFEQIFRDQEGSIQIINKVLNDDPGNAYYEAILHGEPKYRGKCQHFEGECDSEKFPGFSLSVYRYNQFLAESPGRGVWFYSQPHYQEGYKFVSDDKINPYFKANLDDKEKLKFDWEGTGVPEEDQNKCETPAECLGSIRIAGNYWVILSEGKFSGEGKATDLDNKNCQVFTKDALNLKAEWIYAEGKKPASVLIIPVR
jgi:hypothetical protein